MTAPTPAATIVDRIEATVARMAREHMLVRAIYLDPVDHDDLTNAVFLDRQHGDTRYRGFAVRRASPGKRSCIYSTRGLQRAIAPRPGATTTPAPPAVRPPIGARVRFAYTMRDGRQRFYEATVRGYRPNGRFGATGWLETIDEAGFRRSVAPGRCEVIA